MAKIKFYFDEHMRRVVANTLIERGYDVTLAVDVGMEGKDDDTEHLLFASQNGMILVTFDRPFAGRTMKRTDHTGLICLSEDGMILGKQFVYLKGLHKVIPQMMSADRCFGFHEGWLANPTPPPLEKVLIQSILRRNHIANCVLYKFAYAPFMAISSSCFPCSSMP